MKKRNVGFFLVAKSLIPLLPVGKTQLMEHDTT